MNEEQLDDLILQSLEHELGGIKVYEKAVECAVNSDLKEEWGKYLEQTRTHVQILETVCAAFGLDPRREALSRGIVRTIGSALLEAMQVALDTGDSVAAELVACEAVVLAETKDHLDWELLGKCAKQLSGERRTHLEQACDKVEDEEDEHLYHTRGWCRELWLKSLGLSPVLPPPEEEHDVKTAIGAARAEQASNRARSRATDKGGHTMAARSRASRKSASTKTKARKSTGRAKTTTRKSATKTSRKASGAKTLAQRKVKKAMTERKAGKLKSGRSGKKVTSRKQAIAIGLSEARKRGAKIPKKKK